MSGGASKRYAPRARGDRRHEASRRWALRLWVAQLLIVVVGVVLLATTDAGVVVVALAVAALLAVHVGARRSLGRELAEAGRLDDDAPER